MELIFDPLFRVPLFVGLLLSLLLPVLGVYLRLRDEWLASLGLAQVSAASGLVGASLGFPIILGGPIGAIMVAFIKNRFSTGNTGYALMILAGWSLTFIIAANTVTGESLGHALTDGQIYFAQPFQLWIILAIVMISFIVLPWMSPHLLRARLFPFHERMNEKLTWRWHLGFDLIVAIGMGAGTATIGLMAAFAMIFIPSWLAFKFASSWKQTLIFAIAFNGFAYLVGIASAIMLDQPYGPIQVAVHLIVALFVWLLLQALPTKMHH
ncbi:MAG: metal ABC transporter permease [Pseudomonadota bacterium]